jgi:hypothetical protein
MLLNIYHNTGKISNVEQLFFSPCVRMTAPGSVAALLVRTAATFGFENIRNIQPLL